MQNKPKIPIAAAIVAFILWITPGLINRDLWKADEPYSFGLVEHIAETGDWIVPTLAGEPFMEKPPIFYLTAAGFVQFLSPWLEPHNAARLASALFMLITAMFIGLSANELIGRKSVGAAIFLLIGSVGLQVTAHKLITDIALIAGLSASIYGLALCSRRRLMGGFWLGTGAGIGFLSKGLLAPGLSGLIAIIMPIFFSDWRKKNYFVSLIVAVVAVLPWILVWPVELYLRSPALFVEWFWNQNLGRFLGYAYVGRRFSPAFYLIHLPWFALPSLPLALWALWRTRGKWQHEPEIVLPLTTFLVMFLTFSLSSSIRTIYALPMLLPLSLLAAAGVSSLPDATKTVSNRIILTLFGLLIALLWTSWIIMMTGKPSFLATYLSQLQPDYVPVVNGPLLLTACLYTVTWFIIVLRASLFDQAYLVNWTGGIVVVWALAMTLWLPWIDAGSSYRSMFTSIKDKIPVQCHTILSQDLGESERAMLVYYTGVIPRFLSSTSVKDNSLLLVQGSSERKTPLLGSDWQVIWEWHRPLRGPGPFKEIFTLYKRDGGITSCK